MKDDEAISLFPKSVVAQRLPHPSMTDSQWLAVIIIFIHSFFRKWVSRVVYFFRLTLTNVGINLRGGQTGMSEQFLYHPQVSAAVE